LALLLDAALDFRAEAFPELVRRFNVWVAALKSASADGQDIGA